MPNSKALDAAASAAICAAYGVDFLEPLKPLAPAEDQETTLPLSSAIDTVSYTHLTLPTICSV